MKLVLLLEETHKEYDYVKREPERERGPYVDEPYGELEDEDGVARVAAVVAACRTCCKGRFAS